MSKSNDFTSFLKILHDKFLAWGLFSFFITLNYYVPQSAPLVKIITDTLLSYPGVIIALQAGLGMTLFTFIASDPFFTPGHPIIILKTIKFMGRSMLMATFELSTAIVGVIPGIIVGTLFFIRTKTDLLFIFPLLSIAILFFVISFLAWWLNENVLMYKNRIPLFTKFYALPKQRTLIYSVLLLVLLVWCLYNKH
ncbi:MAG TPA: hypothetical protein VGV92_09305 [Gammaproteobacteria bacterium]|nr:hypothetical protein [Gammaproteobacteria bacterium]